MCRLFDPNRAYFCPTTPTAEGVASKAIESRCKSEVGYSSRAGIPPYFFTFKEVFPINYKPKLATGVFREILSAMWDIVNNEGADDGEFEGHSWSFNPYGFYCNEKEFESKEEMSKWYDRFSIHRRAIYREAEKAIEHLELIQVDPRQWVQEYFWGDTDISK